MKFSIVIPTYNEKEDIVGTLDSLVGLKWPDKEIIVVDDSTDETPDIVRRYADRGVRLIRPEKRGGRCEARNRGILESTGEVLVILNADVLLPPDFLDRLSKHYQSGADYVLVESKVLNMNELFPRYLEAQHKWFYDGVDWIEWTEGFSCRRDAAIAIGMFPTGYPIPLVAGEDGIFGEKLRAGGYRKVIDRSIFVTHIAPATMEGYWPQRVGRTYATPLIWRYVEKRSMFVVFFRMIKALPGNLFATFLLIPIALSAFRFTKFSPKGKSDFFGFMWAAYVEHLAGFWGLWKAFKDLIRKEYGLA